MTEIEDNISTNLTYPVITTGTFDGLHLGHQKVLAETIRIANKYNGTPSVLTFWPHPRHVLGKGEFSLLNTFEEKKQLFNNLGIEHVFYQPFTLDFAKLSSEEYVEKILVKKLKVKVLVVGYDHQFGKERTGKFETLGELAEKFNFKLERVAALDMDGLNVSSTKIRTALEVGNVNQANKMLGYDYFISGTVVEGFKVGREIGFPTANIKLTDDKKLLPTDGVYAVYAKVEEKFYQGMLSIGYRPTFENQPHVRSVEVNLFNFSKEIYNMPIAIYFIERLRDEVKYKSIDELISQLHIDKENSINLLKSTPKMPDCLK
ncbi:MAG: bifunctional riboflavin kinase/FAD synthetase [Bacteroidia bacterium]|nr:bifunctional riboflavin kinase/FAD synthetase [Bacteroidia bacterium]